MITLPDFVQLQISNPTWQRYTIDKYLAEGAYGKVYKIFDSKCNQTVAMKYIVIKDCPANVKSKILDTSFREFSILDHVNSHYLLTLFDAEITVVEGSLIALWLVVPFKEYTLFDILHKEKNFFSFDAIIKIAFQILKGLQYLYDAKIIHRDLKPDNIGINEKFELRILDFGLSRELETNMTQNVSVPHYRAIEMFNSTQYSAAVDMWSTGCILAELFTKRPLFEGKNNFDQMKKIVMITGITDDDIGLYPKIIKYRNEAPAGDQLRNSIQGGIKIFGCFNEDNKNTVTVNEENVIDLICRMLALDPDKRVKPSEALEAQLFLQNNEILSQFPDDIEANHFNERTGGKEIDEEMIIEAINRYKLQKA